MFHFSSMAPADLVVRKLDGPPELGFDCGNTDQNAFLYEHAWEDQQELLSVTYRYYADGLFAAYATLSADALALAFRERGVRLRYETVGALKLAQLAVDRRFQGRGLGETIVGDAFGFAQRLSLDVGCRFVSVDARPGLDPWYERLGFTRNKLMQERRTRFAMEKNRALAHLTTSMRLDIRMPATS